jgi:ribose 5-phosphate isomerase B
MTIVLASDHAGFTLRSHLAEFVRNKGDEAIEVGARSEEPYDYPDAADEAVAYVLDGRARFGVFVCGTGIGICMRANRYKGIRGAPCTSVQMALLAREHNDANVLCLGARLTPDSLAVQILEAFLSEPASDVERHKRRVAKLDGNEIRP